MFLVPALFLFGLIVVYPFIKGVRISLTDWDGFSPIYHYVGFENFKRILKDPSIKGPILNSLFYTVVTVVVNNLAGLGVAVALRKDNRRNRIFRTCIFMPFVLSLVLTGLYGNISTAMYFMGFSELKAFLETRIQL